MSFSQTLAHGNSKEWNKSKKHEEGKKRGMSMERTKAGTKNEVPTTYY